MKKLFFPLSSLVVLMLIIILVLAHQAGSIPPLSPTPSPHPIWAIESIDTMKYSRDLAQQKDGDASFDNVIDLQVANIASTGASYVAIATPYDEEFVPFLTRWVDAARKYHLHVWFRGNFSGWEQWFGYKPITRAQHIAMTSKFITTHPTLFMNGDIFTACPECENGGPGDPRKTGDIAGHRQFLIDEYNTASAAFMTINKKVNVGYNSMNYDVAMAVMDKPTTAAVGGVVAIDHYVKDSGKLVANIQTLKDFSGGQVFLGEIGAPIPDIHGKMTEAQQADWIKQNLDALVASKSVIGLNYWVNLGGSTALWNNDESPRAGVAVLTSYFSRRVTQ